VEARGALLLDVIQPHARIVARDRKGSGPKGHAFSVWMRQVPFEHQDDSVDASGVGEKSVACTGN
jgi:hypothetical protein